MTEELKETLKQKFEKGSYDAFPYIVEKDLLKINLSNYKKISIELINIFNDVRSNRDITQQEYFYRLEKMFANNFFETMYNAIKRHENLDELPLEVTEDLKKYYHFIKSITSVGKVYNEEEENYEKNK